MAIQMVVSLPETCSVDRLFAQYKSYIETHFDADMCFSRYLGLLILVGSDAEFDSLNLNSNAGDHIW